MSDLVKSAIKAISNDAIITRECFIPDGVNEVKKDDKKRQSWMAPRPTGLKVKVRTS